MEKITETKATKLNGFAAMFLWIGGVALEAWLVYTAATLKDPMYLWVIIPFFLALATLMNGFFLVHPNEGKALVLFGKYNGTVRENGFWFVNPFVTKKAISLKIHNFNSEKIKVNDHDGNPIEIAAVVVWRVVETARALFDVENYEQFVDVQSETAIRALASEYPYDSHDDDRDSLRGSPQVIADALQKQVQTRLEIAGVEILEARISHLAYAHEIAQAMLRRQQAQAIVAARKKIVEGAVGMVQDALIMLSEQKIVELDEDKKATMVNNLMVALVSESDAQPVINTGTLYQ
jgi:regulator of protease activity HflC (stomatin/prohibitin superfamily)